MKNYFFNIFISAIVCFFAAALTFLVGNEGGVTAGAITAGITYGLITSLAYCFGGMMQEDGGKFNGKRLLAMLISGVIGGTLGGLLIGIG